MFDKNLLGYYMNKANVTKKDASEALNISYSTTCKKLRGAASITTEEAKTLCDICNITDNDIKSQIFL